MPDSQVLLLGTSHVKTLMDAHRAQATCRWPLDFTWISDPLWRLLINRSELVRSGPSLRLEIEAPDQCLAAFAGLDERFVRMRQNLERIIANPVLVMDLDRYSQIVVVDGMFRFNQPLKLQPEEQTLRLGSMPLSVALASELPMVAGDFDAFTEPFRSRGRPAFKPERPHSFRDVIAAVAQQRGAATGLSLLRFPGFITTPVDHAAYRRVHRWALDQIDPTIGLLDLSEALVDPRTGRIRSQFAGANHHANADFAQRALEELRLQLGV